MDSPLRFLESCGLWLPDTCICGMKRQGGREEKRGGGVGGNKGSAGTSHFPERLVMVPVPVLNGSPSIFLTLLIFFAFFRHNISGYFESFAISN